MKKQFQTINVIVSMALVILFFSCSGKLINTTVKTQYGKVKGLVNETGTVVAFKGIPYAAPPVGDLRWKEPQSPVAWKGVRDATKFCESCMQVRAFNRLPTGPWTEEFMVQDSISEDCLFLNIWTPAISAADKLPVFVYIHGGGFSEGSGSIAVYDGEELAKKGIVVVNINYRLGIFGFFVHPELTAESPNHASGNYGLLDQVAALKWVRDNIAAFGGDPGHVTIAGQSAGAMSVSSLIVSPLAKDLFHGAITESGSSFIGFGNATKLADAEPNGIEFAKRKGASSLADLRAMSAADLMASDTTKPALRFGTVLDGYFFTGSTNDIFDAGKQNDTPFITGMNADEVRYSGEKNDTYKKHYPSSSEDEAKIVDKIAAQEQARLNAYLWLEYRAKTAKTNGYVYYFDRGIPWPEHPEFGAFHTGEVPYVFNNLKMMNRPWTKVDTAVADQMSSYWVNFIKTGDPNGSGLPEWRAFSDSKEVMRIGENTGMIPITASQEKYDFLKQQLLAPRPPMAF
jgi:para-nitrobenzyl esterase